ncbi:MAG: hypothetical protein HY000_18300, partial [Planctomycetes bacterium]|nr:hypothetical protein [Planctomycetota bacterium]
MIRGLYSTAAALDVAAQNHDVVATNLAHASMPGYRRRAVSMGSFEQTLSQAAAGTLNGATPATIGLKTHVVFEPGEIVFTGNPLDVALHGDGF